jgi:hypothetical protein
MCPRCKSKDYKVVGQSQSLQCICVCQHCKENFIIHMEVAFAHLYAALMERDTCLSCGGNGFDYVDDGHGEAIADPCQCTQVAYNAVGTYARLFQHMLLQFWKRRDRPPPDQTDIEDLVQVVLEEMEHGN